jgi:hypothetical protein
VDSSALIGQSELVAAGDEVQPGDMAYAAGRDARTAPAGEAGVGDAVRSLPLVRTRRVLLQTFVCTGLVVIVAAEIFGPGWVLWVPTMTILGLTGAGLEKVLGLNSPSEDDRDD